MPARPPHVCVRDNSDLSHGTAGSDSAGVELIVASGSFSSRTANIPHRQKNIDVARSDAWRLEPKRRPPSLLSSAGISCCLGSVLCQSEPCRLLTHERHRDRPKSTRMPRVGDGTYRPESETRCYCCGANVADWHLADSDASSCDVCFWG
jgi:hypothetical protein